MNKEEFVNELSKFDIKIEDATLEKFNIYIEELLKYNEHTNLTAIRDYDSVLLKHFFDSLMIERFYDFSSVETLLDIGTGAGFPGMVLAIIHPNIKVTLLDSNNKKLKFLELLTMKLGINNVEIVHERAEEFANKRREYYDVTTSRAVSDLQILSELSIPFCKINGYFIPLKGNVDDELKRSKKIIAELGGNIEKTFTYKLIKEDSLRNIILIKKIKKTPDKYPRAYSKIKNDVEKSSKIK